MGHVTVGVSQRLITRFRISFFLPKHSPSCSLLPACKPGCPPRMFRVSTRLKRRAQSRILLTHGICSTSPPTPISTLSSTFGPTSRSSLTITCCAKVTPLAQRRENLLATMVKTMTSPLRRATYFTLAMPTKTSSPGSPSQTKTPRQSRHQGQGRSNINSISLPFSLPSA